MLMLTPKNKRLWQLPWGYPETVLTLIAIVMAGYALQASLGNVDFHYLHWPVNGMCGLILVVVILLLAVWLRSNPFILWFSGVSFSVGLLGALLLFTIVMGLTPQMETNGAAPHHLITKLGLNRMTTSWPFVLLYITLLLSLGTLVVRNMIPFRRAKYAFYLNHLGLWLVLFTTGLGASDLRRYVMYVQVKDNNPEWRVYNEKNEVLELPVAIYLEEFILEQYDTRLTIIDNGSGEALPKDFPQFVQLGSDLPKGQLLEWEVEVLAYIPEAVRTLNEAYEEIPMAGSAPAANVKITNTKNGQTKTGWVSCGSFAQLYRKIDLDSTRSLVMTAPEPKRFASKVVVYSQYANKPDSALIEVNKPLEHHGWMIYQYSYEEKLGKASPYSSFELVYDPWKKYVYFSFLLLAIGSLALFLQLKKRRGERL
jgi:hypothetical protein